MKPLYQLRQRYQTFQSEGQAELDSRSQLIETAFGRIEYAIEGDGQAVLVSHGSLGGYDQGIHSLYFLKGAGIQLIAPSRFGYLRTPMPMEPTPLAQAKAYVALLDSLSIEKSWIVGLSAGGMSAVSFAIHFPHRCHGLILISAISQRPTHTPPIRFVVEHVLTNEFLGWVLATYYPRLVARSTGDNYSLVEGEPDLKKAFLSLAWPPLAAQRRSGMLNDLCQVESLPDFPWEEISVPTLIVHGRADPFVPFAHAQHLAEKIPGARFLVFEPGGHLSFLTHNEKTRAVLIDFIKVNSPS